MCQHTSAVVSSLLGPTDISDCGTATECYCEGDDSVNHPIDLRSTLTVSRGSSRTNYMDRPLRDGCSSPASDSAVVARV